MNPEGSAERVDPLEFETLGPGRKDSGPCHGVGRGGVRKEGNGGSRRPEWRDPRERPGDGGDGCTEEGIGPGRAVRTLKEGSEDQGNRVRRGDPLFLGLGGGGGGGGTCPE